MNSATIVQKLWNYCNGLKPQGRTRIFPKSAPSLPFQPLSS